MADVDAITLSLTKMSLNGLSSQTAVMGIVIAATVNNLIKAGMAGTIGQKALGLKVAGPMVLSLAAGLATVSLF